MGLNMYHVSCKCFDIQSINETALLTSLQSEKVITTTIGFVNTTIFPVTALGLLPCHNFTLQNSFYLNRNFITQNKGIMIQQQILIPIDESPMCACASFCSSSKNCVYFESIPSNYSCSLYNFKINYKLAVQIGEIRNFILRSNIVSGYSSWIEDMV